MTAGMFAKLPLGSVVVGVDGNRHDQAAVVWAAHQAHLEHRPLVIVYASSTPAWVVGDRRRAASRQMSRIAGRRHTDRAHRQALTVAPGLRVETLVRAADLDETLIRLGDAARMVVVGSPGAGPVASVHPSVALRVSAAASCPVVVVRDTASPTPRVVVGTDLTEASTAAVEFGFIQASLRGVPLTVLHAVSPLDLSRDFQLSPEAAAPTWLSEAVAGLREKYVDVDVELQVVEGPALPELVAVARNADLVVVGSRPHRGPAGLHFTSLSRALVEHAPCSVAVVRPAGIPDAGGRPR